MRAVPVPVDDVRLARLMQLYIHEWSGKIPVPLGDDALFVYPHLARFREADGEAVLFVDGGRLAGFALACADAGGTWHVEELFVVAGARRRGAGRAAAVALFARHPGRWSLTVREENPDALAFWSRVTAVAPTDERGADGVLRRRFTFDAR